MVLGDKILANVVVKGYIYREKWKHNYYIIFLEDTKKNIFTIQLFGKLKIGSPFVLEGEIKNHSCFNGQKQIHVQNWSLLNIPNTKV